MELRGQKQPKRLRNFGPKRLLFTGVGFMLVLIGRCVSLLPSSQAFIFGRGSTSIGQTSTAATQRSAWRPLTEVGMNRRILLDATLLGAFMAPTPVLAGGEDAAALQQVQVAAAAVVQLKKELPAWVKLGPEGAERVIACLSGTVNAEVAISIPAGDSAGVDIEGMVVTGVSRPSLGWKTGDVVKSLNGMETSNQEELVQAVGKLRSKGEPLKFMALRKSASPFVTLKGALEEVYNSVPSTVVLPDPQDVTDKVQGIKVFASFAQDGQGKLDTILPSVDSLAGDLDLYVQAPAAAAAAALSANAESKSKGKEEEQKEYVPLF